MSISEHSLHVLFSGRAIDKDGWWNPCIRWPEAQHHQPRWKRCSHPTPMQTQWLYGKLGPVFPAPLTPLVCLSPCMESFDRNFPALFALLNSSLSLPEELRSTDMTRKSKGPNFYDRAIKDCTCRHQDKLSSIYFSWRKSYKYALILESLLLSNEAKYGKGEGFAYASRKKRSLLLLSFFLCSCVKIHTLLRGKESLKHDRTQQKAAVTRTPISVGLNSFSWICSLAKKIWCCFWFGTLPHSTRKGRVLLGICTCAAVSHEGRLVRGGSSPTVVSAERKEATSFSWDFIVWSFCEESLVASHGGLQGRQEQIIPWLKFESARDWQ